MAKVTEISRFPDDPQLAKYAGLVWRKLEETPKHKHKRALVLTARKLTRLVHALLTKNQPFVARRTHDDPPEALGVPQAT